MEERKLNFNAPLLSARRFSTTTAVASSNGEKRKITENSLPNRPYTIPFYKSDVNLEQVTELAAVPFLWEQIPGQPKDGGPESEQLEEASTTPRLPPRRDLDIIKYPLQQEFEDRPKNESCSLNDNVTSSDCIKERNEEKEDLDLEHDDDVYSDAFDTLSRTDSVSMNCSVSGVSGLEGQVIKQSGTFSTDPQTRDFLLNRFLPAAKAMALEPPQYASRKQPVAVEQSRQVIEVVSEDRRPPVNQSTLMVAEDRRPPINESTVIVTDDRRPAVNKSIVMPHYGDDTDEEESEDEVDEDDDYGNLSSKGCGLFPQLCLNKSLCLLNPVPGLKVRTHSSMSSISEARKAAYAETHSQTVKKLSRDAVYKRQSDSGVRSPKRQSDSGVQSPKRQSDSGVRSPKLLGIENRVTGGSNRFTYSSDHQMTNRSSPFRRGISPYRNERPQSPFRGGGFLGVPKEAENLRATRLNLYDKASSKSHELFPNRLNLYNKASCKSQELVSHRSLRKGSGSLTPTVEKTLYVDTVNFAKISFSNSNSSDTKGQKDSAVENFHTSRESGGIEENAFAESSLQDVNSLNLVKGGSILETKVPGSVKANLSSFSGMLHPGGQPEMLECFRLDGELDHECKSLECVKVIADGNLNGSSEQNLEVCDPGYLNTGSEQSPLPPPLPKKPSQSWLWRARHSVSSQNSYSHVYHGTRFHPKKQDPNTAVTSTKWETIVKTSYSHHDYVRYSEELTAHYSQQSKS